MLYKIYTFLWILSKLKQILIFSLFLFLNYKLNVWQKYPLSVWTGLLIKKQGSNEFKEFFR